MTCISVETAKDLFQCLSESRLTLFRSSFLLTAPLFSSSARFETRLTGKEDSQNDL